jgi:hypothetical protein
MHLQPDARRIGLADRQARLARPEFAAAATHPHIVVDKPNGDERAERWRR